MTQPYNIRYSFFHYLKGLLLVCILLCSNIISGQQITISSDRDKMLIGEVFTVSIKVRDLDKSQPIIKWGNLPDSIQAIEIIERSKIDTFEINGLMQYQQNITCIAFDSGKFTIPPIKFLIKNNSTSTSAFFTAPISIQVLSADVSLMKDYHDIKDIIEPENEFPWLRYLLIGAFIITLLVFINYFTNRKKKHHQIFKVKSIQEELAAALQALDELEKADLFKQQQVKQHYVRLYAICKHFSQVCLQQQLQHSTTDEWITILQKSEVAHHDLQTALQLFRLCDAVKFARFVPDDTTNKSSITKARHFISVLAKQKIIHAL